MTDTSSQTPVGVQSWGLGSISSVKTWQQVSAVALIVIGSVVGTLAYFDRLPGFTPKPDLVLQGQIDGLSVMVESLSVRIKLIEDTAAAKPDIAEVRARLAVIESKTKTGLMTGSISKKR